MRRPYREVLEEAWVQHLTPRTLGAPTVVSLFAGCGGSSLGYSMAGFREILASDWDAMCEMTFRLNFLGVSFLCGDVRTLNGKTLLSMANIGEGELDVLDGSPPCQGFSTAGKRRLDDGRNDLGLRFAELLAEVRPRVFVMENVSGMVRGKMRLIFARTMRALKAAGYHVSCRMLDAKWFLVPQERKRLIWIGIREDMGIEPSHPSPEVRPYSVMEALVNCPNGMSDGPFVGRRLEIAKGIRPWRDGSDMVKDWSFNLKRLAWNRPSRTVVRMLGSPDSHWGGGLIHPDENRHLTIAELKRIMSFPDSFRFEGDYKIQWAQIGNSVPPLMMRAIALHLRKLLAKIDNYG